MVRVHGGRRAPSVRAGAARHRHAQQSDQKKKPSYKVVLEEVSEQKKLKTFLSFNAEAPAGFTFIPAGDPQLTNRCKQLARDDGSKVYIVSMSDPKNAELSHEVHRVGYHFSSIVVENACLSLGVTLTESGRVLQSSFATLNEELPTRHGKKLKTKGKTKGRASPAKFDLSQSQATIDTQAREAIRDLFPKIPDADLHETVSRSFQKGRDLVGTSSDLSLARRAHLAVLAHIRHTHTQYDQLLKLMPWADARKRVEGPTLDVLISWRDDVDDDTNVMRDVLREVIIISDNEDEGEEDEADFMRSQSKPRHQQHEREPSVEIVSVNNNVQTHQLDLNMEPPISTSERPLEYIPREVPMAFQRTSDLRREERRGAQRHQRWKEALSRKRNNPAPHPPLTNFVEPVPNPFHQNSVRIEPRSRLRSSRIPPPDPPQYTYDGSGDVQSNPFQNLVPKRRFDHLSSHAHDAWRIEQAYPDNPMQQAPQPSRNRPDFTGAHPQYLNNGHSKSQITTDLFYSTPEARRAPTSGKSSDPRYVSNRPSWQDRDLERIAVSAPLQQYDEPSHRRRSSQRILPSIEADDIEGQSPCGEPVVHPHEMIPSRANAAYGLSQHGPRFVTEPRKQTNGTVLKRVRNEDDLYIVDERQEAPATYVDQGRNIVVSSNERATVSSARPLGRLPLHDDEPVVVEYNSRVGQFPRVPLEKFAKATTQSQPNVQPRHDLARGPSDFRHEPKTALSFENHPIVYEQAIQHSLPSNSHRMISGPTYPNEHRPQPALQPAVPQAIHMESTGGRTFRTRREDPSRNVQHYDNQGRALNEHAIPRHETVTYVSYARERE